MDASIIAGLAAAGVWGAIAVSGDVGGAVDALGDAIEAVFKVDDLPRLHREAKTYRAILRHGDEWDEATDGEYMCTYEQGF